MGYTSSCMALRSFKFDLGPPPFFGVSEELNFYRKGMFSPLPNHHSGGPGFISFPSPVSPYLSPPETGWPSYNPRPWVPILVASYDTQGVRWGYSNSRPPHGNVSILFISTCIFNNQGLRPQSSHKSEVAVVLLF